MKEQLTFGGAETQLKVGLEHVEAVDDTAATGGGFNLRDSLLGTNKLTDGDGPLAKAMRGENLTAQEQAELDKLAKNNRNVIVLKPRGEGTSW